MTMKRKDLHIRTWLHPVSSRSDSYVMLRVGDSEWEFTLADCNRRVRIHSYVEEQSTKAAVKKELRRYKVLRQHLTSMIEEVERRWDIK